MGASAEFAVAALLAHAQLPATLQRLAPSFRRAKSGPLPLRDAAFAGERLRREGGLDPLVRGLWAAPACGAAARCRYADDVRNGFLGRRGAGIDLAAQDVQRARDLGVAGFNGVRAALGLPRAQNFSFFARDARDAAALRALEELYPAGADAVELLVGALLERRVRGGAVGETVAALLEEQFVRLRDGDRFWFEAPHGVHARVLDALFGEGGAGGAARLRAATSLGAVLSRVTGVDFGGAGALRVREKRSAGVRHFAG